MWIIDNSNKYENYLLLKSYFNINSYKKVFSNKWNNLFLVYKKNKKIISFANLYIIKKYKIHLYYIPGGIEGEFTQDIISDFKIFLNSKMNFRSVALINLHNELSFKQIMPKNFLKIINLHETRMIMKKNLKEKNLLSSYTKNWRHNYKRSLKKEFHVKINNDPNISELISLYKQMENLKNYKIFISYNFLETLFNNLKNFIVHYEARIEGRLIAFRTCIIKDKVAWDLLACSNIESKKNYCTYYIMHQIFNDCINKNVDVYDFSGVDPKNNTGVYNFKKGAGSILYKKIGEYSYSKNLILSIFIVIFFFIKRIFIK